MTISPVPTDRAEWLALRRRYLTASDVAALFDAQADYKASRFALHHIKSGTIEEPEIDHERVEWGLRLERPIAEKVAEELGAELLPGCWAVDDECPRLAATLDFRLRLPGMDSLGVLEIKNVDAAVYRSQWVNGEPPLQITLQHQAQMAATGYSWGVIGALVGGNRLKRPQFQARPRIIDSIRERVVEFWANVEAGKPPAVDGSDATADALRQLYPAHAEQELDLSGDNEAPEICAGFLNAAAAKKESDKVYDLYRNLLAAKAAGHKRVRVQGYWINGVITPDNPGRPALPGEIVGARKGSVRWNVKEAAQ